MHCVGADHPPSSAAVAVLRAYLFCLATPFWGD